MPKPTQPKRPASTGETKPAKPARRREVYSSDEVVHRWANAADPFDIRGANVSTRRGDGKAHAVWLYSYNLPIAVRYLHKGLPVWLVVNDVPSRTTSKHRWLAHTAVPEKSRLFDVPVIVGGNVGAITYRYYGALTPPDADTHRRNLDAMVANEIGYADASARAATAIPL